MNSKKRVLFAMGVAAWVGLTGWLWYEHGYGGRAARLANSPRAEERLAAVGKLRGLGGDLARRTLYRLSGDPDRRVAAAAVRALGERKDRRNQELLERIVVEGKSGGARGEAAAALAAHAPADRALLVKTMRSDPDPRARAGAALGLARSRDRASLPDLLAALDDPDARVRIRAITAIHRILIFRFPYQADQPRDVRRAQMDVIRSTLASHGLLGEAPAGDQGRSSKASP